MLRPRKLQATSRTKEMGLAARNFRLHMLMITFIYRAVLRVSAGILVRDSGCSRSEWGSTMRRLKGLAAPSRRLRRRRGGGRSFGGLAPRHHRKPLGAAYCVTGALNKDGFAFIGGAMFLVSGPPQGNLPAKDRGRRKREWSRPQREQCRWPVHHRAAKTACWLRNLPYFIGGRVWFTLRRHDAVETANIPTS